MLHLSHLNVSLISFRPSSLTVLAFNGNFWINRRKDVILTGTKEKNYFTDKNGHLLKYLVAKTKLVLTRFVNRKTFLI